MKEAPPPSHGGQRVAQRGPPLGAGRAAMIMMHGRGAGPEDMLALADVLAHPAFTFLAPAAAANTWYPYSFLAPIEQNEPGISSGIAVVHRLIDDAVGAGLQVERIILLGFSQGACLTAEFAANHARRYGGVVVYSGGLIGPPGSQWNYEGGFDGTPVFLGCSDVDSHVPETRVNESAVEFERMGAVVTRRIYPGMGHLVNEDEIGWTQRLLDAVLAYAG